MRRLVGEGGILRNELLPIALTFAHVLLGARFMLLRQEQQRIPRGHGHEKRFRGRVADIRCSSTRLGPRRKRKLGNDMAARCREGGLKPTRAGSECIALSRRSLSIGAHSAGTDSAI